MEVKPGFAKRAKAIAEATPREAIANLLKAMLPREPVRTRPVQTYTPPAPPQGTMTDDGEVRVADPFVTRLKRTVRTRSARSYSYTIVSRVHGARPGTKRAKQLDIVLAFTNTRQAIAAGAEWVDFKYAEQIGLIILDK